VDLGVDAAKAMYDAVYYLVFHLTRALTAFLQRDSYLYWPFLLSTLLLVILLGRRRIPGSPGFFDWRLWWHPSARADYRLYVVNALAFPVLASLLLFNDARVVQWMSGWLGAQAAAPSSPLGEVALRVAFTLCFFVAYDLARFIGHSLMHEVPALWQFHKVHHSAQVLTPMTSFRLHPVEMFVMAWISALMTGVTTLLFNLAGAQVSLYTFLGLHVALWVFSLIDNLRHSPVWISYGTSWGRWLISPAHHQLHHSIEPRHWGCNRGSNLAIWDRLWGTLYVPGKEPEEFRMGLGDGTEPKWNSVWRMYLAPFAGCARQVAGALRGKSMDKEPDSPVS